MLLILNEVIVGQSVHSLLKSYSEEIPIVLPQHHQPTIDLKFDKEMKVEQLKTKSQSELWSMLKFLCAMKGLIVNHQDLEYVRIKDNQVKFRGVEIEFQKCHVFPHTMIKPDLEIESTIDQDSYKIIDFMRLKFCDASNLVTIFPKDNFISKIESTGKKELYSVSYLTKQQLTKFDFSDTMVRFIVQKLLVDRKDIHRPLIHKNGKVRRIPKLEVLERLVFPMEEIQYKSTKRIKFYDRKKRVNIIKTYRRNHPSIEG